MSRKYAKTNMYYRANFPIPYSQKELFSLTGGAGRLCELGWFLNGFVGGSCGVGDGVLTILSGPLGSISAVAAMYSELVALAAEATALS